MVYIRKNGGTGEKIKLSDVPAGGVFFPVGRTRKNAPAPRIKSKVDKEGIGPYEKFCVELQSGDGDTFPNDLSVSYYPDASIIIE